MDAGQNPGIRVNRQAEIRLALIGVGNCASSLVQAIEWAREGRSCRGLEHATIGGYSLGDVRVVLAYDVAKTKVGSDLREAISAPPNCATEYIAVGPQWVEVAPGVLSDGLDGPLGTLIEPHPRCAERSPRDVENELRASAVDVAVCYLPTGSRHDVHTYAAAACRAGVAFINATPEPVVHDRELRAMYEQAGLSLLGDDMRSHAGATALHTLLIEFFQSRNIEVGNTYQLNIGGNADFRNLADERRAASKRATKRAALLGAGVNPDMEILAGPTGFVPFLKDRKTAIIHLEGISVMGMKLNLDARLEVEDSPNVVSVIADAIRIAFLTRHSPAEGQAACPHLFKNPLSPLTNSIAQAAYRRLVERLNGNVKATAEEDSQ